MDELLPPLLPEQVQVHGPLPLKSVTVPALQRFGSLDVSEVNEAPLALPQAPLTGSAVNVAVIVQLAVIAPVV